MSRPRNLRCGSKESDRHGNYTKNLEYAPDYFQLTLSEETNPDEFVLDDRTWDDLDMDDIYVSMDKTYTAPGYQRLYDILRRMQLSPEKVAERAEQLEAVRKDSSFRKPLRSILAKVGHVHGCFLARFIWEPNPSTDVSKIAATLGFTAALLAPLLFLVSVKTGLIATLAVYFANMTIYNKVKPQIWSETSSMAYLGKVLDAASAIGGLKNDSLDPLLGELSTLSASTKRLRSSLSTIVFILSGPAADLLTLINVYLLIEVRSYIGVKQGIGKYSSAVKRIFSLVGYMDALQSIVAYRDTLEKWCEPEFHPDCRLLEAREAYHPLISKPVKNTARLGPPGMIITGSNMSGKTTFLRTVALNAVLAQTIATVLADSYKADIWRIVTAIRKRDDVTEGRSLYMDEAQAVLRIVAEAERGGACLTVIDELFSGTNSDQRVAAAIAVLRYLAGRSCCSLVATHDMDIPRRVADHYQCAHFQEQTTDEGLKFDYKLHEGVASRANAIDVLRIASFHSKLIQEADRLLRGDS